MEFVEFVPNDLINDDVFITQSHRLTYHSSLKLDKKVPLFELIIMVSIEIKFYFIN
jgi:hypothetical protein